MDVEINLMTRNLTYILLLAILFAACNNGSTPSKVKGVDSSYIVMHKGLHLGGKLAPENSLDAINFAARVGARYIEIDVCATKDGEIVLLHDSYLNDCCYNASDYSPISSEKIYLKTITFDDLRKNYVLISDNPSMRRPVPTLEEALILCKTKGLHPYIEIKEDFSNKSDIKRVYDTATRILGKGQYSITSFLQWALEYLRNIDKDVELYGDMIEDVNYLKKYNINYYSRYEPSWYKTSPNYESNISEVHKAGLLASTWTVPKEAYDTIVIKGYDGILTDDIVPTYKKEYAIWDNYSDGNFNSYDIEGQVFDNIVSLNKGQSIYLKDISIDSLYLGGLYFTVEARGRFEINATNLKVERKNQGHDYAAYQFQYLLHKDKPSFSLTAMEDSVKVKSIWIAVTQY